MRTLAAVCLVVMSGCFLELRGGYYPSLTATSTSTTTGRSTSAEEGAFVLGAYLGFRVDGFGVAVAVAPNGAGGTTPRGLSPLEGDAQMQGTSVRVDVDLPFRPWADGLFRPRGTFGWESFKSFNFHPAGGGASRDYDVASGHGYFGGFSLAAPGGFYSLALGPSWFSFEGERSDRADRLSITGWGAEARLMIAGWFPSFFSHYRDSASRTQSTPWYKVCFRRVSTYGLQCY